MRLPTGDDLRKVVRSSDHLAMVIRAHQLIEMALTTAIGEALPDPHALELDRLSFALKVDLAISLGTLRSDSRPLFMKINQIRNDFAHRNRADFTDDEAQDLRNLFSEHQRHGLQKHYKEADSPFKALRLAIATTFFEATHAAEATLERKLHREVLKEATEEFLGKIAKDGIPGRSPEFDKEFEEKLRKRVEAKKRRE